MSDADVQWLKQAIQHIEGRLDRIDGRIDKLDNDHRALMKDVSFVKGAQLMLLVVVIVPMVKYVFFA